MAESLVRAALEVLVRFSDHDLSGVDPKAALAQDVSRFLRSLQHFPRGPLPFPLEIYRDFFVLVAHSRSTTLGIDARYTIDAMRNWLEESAEEERTLLDKRLVANAWMMPGPCEMTCKLLALLARDGGSQDCFDDVFEVADDILCALSGAKANVPSAILSLLGILLDALAELGCLDSSSGREAGLRDKAAIIMVRLIWRQDEAIRIAAGILERLEARNGGSAFGMSVAMAQLIVSELVREATCPETMTAVGGAAPLVGVCEFFGLCLRTMQRLDEHGAFESILSGLTKPLSELLSSLLERTAQIAFDDHLAELDMVATRLYDDCCQIAVSVYSKSPIDAGMAFVSYL